MDTRVFKQVPRVAFGRGVFAKLAELMPMDSGDVRAVLGSRRITIEVSEIEEILNIIRQHVGVE